MSKIITRLFWIASLVACAHGARRVGSPRGPAAVDASRAWSEFGDCVIWPYDTPIIERFQDGVEVFHALDIASGKDLLTTNPEACLAHRSADGKTRKFKSASITPKGKLTSYEALSTGCRVYGGPIVSATEQPNLEPVKSYGDKRNPKFHFLAFPSRSCNALFTPEPDIAGYVNP